MNTPGPGLECWTFPGAAAAFSDNVKGIQSLESLVNPFATQQHPARSMMYLIQTPRVQPDTNLLCSSYNNFHNLLSFSGEGRRQHLLLQQR